MRFHTQTAGVSLTAQQPENNVMRTALEALSAVLGGTQSLHTNALDEVLALPTEDAARLALRTQQVIVHESSVPDVIDPLGGSYFLERMTNDIEAEAEEVFARIDRTGNGSMLEGVLAGIENGYFQGEIAESAFREQTRFEAGSLVKVGVNRYAEEDSPPLDILVIPPAVEERQLAGVRQLRERRDGAAAARALEVLVEAAATEVNLMELLIDCARAWCTEGEIVGALRSVFGEYRETPRF
jgi:methylmalonyl-CoA mutase, N-terminal domain